MAVRVKIKLKKGKREMEATALANAGFESEEPEIVLPLNLAKRLGISKNKLKTLTYDVAGGQKVKGWFLRNGIEVKVITQKKILRWVKTNVSLLEMEREVIMSDKLIDALNIDLEKVGEGLWRFRGEKKLRKSEFPEYW